MPKKTPIELPPALTTRAANKGRKVGAPDMPRPKRTHEEVVVDQERTAQKKARQQKKHDQAQQRVLELEGGLAEDAPTESQLINNPIGDEHERRTNSSHMPAVSFNRTPIAKGHKTDDPGLEPVPKASNDGFEPDVIEDGQSGLR